jgi:hypothetical protein
MKSPPTFVLKSAGAPYAERIWAFAYKPAGPVAWDPRCPRPENAPPTAAASPALATWQQRSHRAPPAAAMQAATRHLWTPPSTPPAARPPGQAATPVADFWPRHAGVPMASTEEAEGAGAGRPATVHRPHRPTHPGVAAAAAPAAAAVGAGAGPRLQSLCRRLRLLGEVARICHSYFCFQEAVLAYNFLCAILATSALESLAICERHFGSTAASLLLRLMVWCVLNLALGKCVAKVRKRQGKFDS